MSNIKITPIGKVEATEQGFAIKLEETYKDALLGLDGFSHLHILWWANQVDVPAYRKITTVDKPYKVGPDKLGIFVTRSPMRPNPIAMTVIPVSKIDYEQGIVYTPYIDADEGTPVLDIKTYLPCSDIVKNCSEPEWQKSFPRSIEESVEFDWSTIFNFDY